MCAVRRGGRGALFDAFPGRCSGRRPERPMAEEPPLNLTSGYVQRALGSLPSQGERRPWRIEQNYVLEWLAFGLSRVDDGALAFG